jgi:hypothetical protein
MQTLKQRRGGAEEPTCKLLDLHILQERIATILLDAFDFVSPSRVAETVQAWLDRLDLSALPSMQAAALMAEAFMMANTLAVFTPSSGGTLAIDRLLRARRPVDPMDAAAIAVLRQSQFRLVAVLDAGTDGTIRLQDLASDSIIPLHGVSWTAALAGLHLAVWLAPLPAGGFACAGEVTPLDEAALAVAMSFVRVGRSSLVNPVRCAESVYRQVLRHGTLQIPGLNMPLPGREDRYGEDGDDLDAIALDWARPGAERDPDDVRFVRAQTGLDTLLAMLASAANTREHGLPDLSAAYGTIALIQLETMQRRAAVGSGSLRMGAVSTALDAGIAAGDISPAARAIFDVLRRQLEATFAVGRAPDTELDKLIGRIQALRAKTVEQGCTEHEALAAAEKVAELLDRYGLSLSELDLQQQSCEGVAVETSRKRAGPLDDCVPATAAFFDCRVWGEKTSGGTLRYVFFGLPADVAASRYLYELVDQAFTREAALFKAGETYSEMPARLRRTAMNSFQIGLGRGITAKLQALRAERETGLRGSSGRDLVVVKAGLVEAELSGLGLNLRTRNRSGGRRVLSEAFDQGRTAGLRFSYTPGIDAAI